MWESEPSGNQADLLPAGLMIPVAQMAGSCVVVWGSA